MVRGRLRRGRREGPRQRTGWFPRRRRPGEPPRRLRRELPGHTATGTLPRIEGLRKQRRFRRTVGGIFRRWRYAVTIIMPLATIFGGIPLGAVVVRDWGNNSAAAPMLKPPPLKAVDDAITGGNQFAKALLKLLPNQQAVQSEFSALPLRLMFVTEGTWTLLGQDEKIPDTDYPASSLTDDSFDATHDYYTVSFSSPAMQNAVTLRITVNWAYTKTQWQLQVQPLSVKESAKLYLDKQFLEPLASGSNAGLGPFTFNDSSQYLLKSLRFTVRHATQEAYLYWNGYGKMPAWAARLANFMRANNYEPGFDLRAPLFVTNVSNLPDDMPINPKAYPDCQHIAASNQYAYAYHSKVCLFEGLYIETGELDPFLQGWMALTVLMKHHDVNYPIPGGQDWPIIGDFLQGGTPAQIAWHLQGQFNRTGYGVPKCEPFNCGELSSIRTSVFGALEAQLGYVYYKQLSPQVAALARQFAGAAAAAIVATQIGANGKIHADTGVTYTRPGQAGGFLESWIPGFKFTNPTTPGLVIAIALKLKHSSLTPLEYNGIIATNSETTFDALGFLNLYRCLRWRVGCLS